MHYQYTGCYSENSLADFTPVASITILLCWTAVYTDATKPIQKNNNTCGGGFTLVLAGDACYV